MTLSVQIEKYPSLPDHVKRHQSANSNGSNHSGAHVRLNVEKAFKIAGSSVRNLTEPPSNQVPTSQVAKLTKNLSTPRIAKAKPKNVLVNGLPAHIRIVTKSVEVAVDLVKSSA